MTTIPYVYNPGKAPADIIPFVMNFHNLVPKDETIVSATVSATPSGLTLTTPVVDVVKGTVLTYVSGGVLGTTYHLHFIAVTQTETIDRVGQLPCQEI